MLPRICKSLYLLLRFIFKPVANYPVFFTTIFLLNTATMSIVLQQINTLNNFSAGSAMAMLDGRLYLAGDNMGHVLVLDNHFEQTSSIAITDAAQAPILKATKPDIEAAVTVCHDGIDKLLLIGSGSHSHYRNNAWLISPDGQTALIDLSSFYHRLKAMGIHELNIEGAAAIPGHILLSNRGNKANPQNQLIITSPRFWTEQATATIDIRSLGPSQTTGSFSGVSGMDYSALSGSLLLTVSTEDTSDTYTDGAIGKSYLWIVNNISGNNGNTPILPNRIIELEAEDPRFKWHKIETVCILNETKTEMTLALAADNDTHNTVLFKALLHL